MQIESDTQRPGRWVLAPRKGSRFLGARERARARAQERRRRIIVVLLEAVGLTGLIGVFPPLRGALWLSGALIALLGVYLGLVAWTAGHRRRTEPLHPRREEREQTGSVTVLERPLARVGS
jgi:hypothetical protein